MAVATPPRRALGDLPVNKFGTPTLAFPTGKVTMSRKRPISEVEEPENQAVVPLDRESFAQLEGTAGKEGLSQDAPLPPQESLIRTSRSSEDAASRVIEPAIEPVEANGDVDADSQASCNMSSLLDFDPDNTMVSQDTAATEVTQPPRSRARQHAETLRLRLRLAQFKIRTNQTNVPFSQLRLTSPNNQPTPPSPETTLRPSSEPSLPKLLPAPVFKPTACSSRMAPVPQVPSSPPDSHRNSPETETDAHEEVFRTPALPRRSAPQQTSSPPESPEIYSRGGKGENLTSSVMKGKAAVSLLGLKDGQ